MGYVDNRDIRDFNYEGEFYVDMSLDSPLAETDYAAFRRYWNVNYNSTEQQKLNKTLPFLSKKEACKSTLDIINKDKKRYTQLLEYYKTQIALIDKAIEDFKKRELEIYQQINTENNENI